MARIGRSAKKLTERSERDKTEADVAAALESSQGQDARFAFVDAGDLDSLSVRPSLVDYVSRNWVRRHFVMRDARARAFADQRDFYLGKIWLLAQPVLDAAMYGIIFGLLLQTSRGIENFIGYLIIGVTFFGILNKMLVGGSGLVRSQKNMVLSFSFPMSCLVFSRSLRNALDAIMPAAVAVLVALVFQWGEPLSWTVILVLPLFLLMAVFGTGLMFISARITAFVPDSKVLIQIVSRAWFYGSCVFYTIDRFSHLPEIQTLMSWNPGYQFLHAIRGAVMYSEVPSLQAIGSLVAWSIGTFIVGGAFFWLAEDRYVNTLDR